MLASGKRKECNLVLHPQRGRKEAFWELHIAVESQGCSGEERLKNLKADEIMGIDVGDEYCGRQRGPYLESRSIKG
ncbi:MAG: hypothetical protein V8R49_05010 [Duodenibacillus massiliensis]